jgi:dihydrofolate synthase / folylpolyglutamate synthase
MMRSARPGDRDLIRPGLGRILEALEIAGHPEHSFRALHIAGTNGKGSTARFCEAILSRLLPRPVGLYTSPHLLSPAERIRVSEEEIPEGALDKGMGQASRVSRVVAARLGEPLSWFEELTWVACDWFRRRGAELAILETGLGGRWDATSACAAEVSVITNVEVDHTEWLGRTIPRIASEKAGILREGTPAVLGFLRPSARRVVAGAARRKRCPVWEAGREFGWEESPGGRIAVRLPGGVAVRKVRLGMEGAFQRENASVACAASWKCASIRGIDARRFERAAREGLEEARLPGRYSTLPGPGNRGVRVDGAHNPAAAAALAQELGRRGRPGRMIALWSMLREKDLRGFVRALSPVLDGWVAYPLDQARAASLCELRGALRKGGAPWKEAGGFPEGFALARRWAGRDGTVLVCGSLMAAADAYRFRLGRLP